MFSVILLNFDKKENSTKQPTSGGLAVQGVLKEPCSIMNPVIKIERLANDAVPSTYTYAYIAKFSRYYFIEDWVWQDGLWEVHMKEDVLASFKTQIGLQTEYVLRTDNTTFYNGDITDTTYPATTDVVSAVVENANPFSPDSIDSGCYIVGMIVVIIIHKSCSLNAFSRRVFCNYSISTFNTFVLGILHSNSIS